MWKKDATGETFLVTKLYTEALATIAVLLSGMLCERLCRLEAT